LFELQLCLNTPGGGFKQQTM